MKVIQKIKKINKFTYAPIFYGALLLVLLFIGLLINLLLIQGSLSDVWTVLGHWNTIPQELAGVRRELWNLSATLIAGIGLALGAIAAQSLTRNPLAEGSTLGLVQGAIFGILFIISFGFTGFLMKYTFAILAGLIAALLIVAILFITKSKSASNKIILAGLAIGIIFKTLSFLMKIGDKDEESLSYAYVLGGAESISSNPLAVPGDYLNDTLMYSAILISVAMVITIFNIKGMNLLELGEDRAKTLGAKVLLTRVLSIITLVLAIPAAVIIIGNLAFLGLFSVHIARWLVRSRNYAKVMPMTLIVSLVIASLGFQMTQHFPEVNSGLWMTFVGAPYLIYVGLKGVQ